MSERACIERTNHVKEHERITKKLHTQQQQIKLLFKLVRQGEHHA